MSPPSTPEKLPTANLFDEIIIVTVGKELKPFKTFSLHKGVVSYYSGYFQAALKENTFQEGQSKRIELPDEEVETFEHFVGWLYTRVLPGNSDDYTAEYNGLIKLWILGDKRQIPLLMNVTIDAMRDVLVKRWILPRMSLGLIWENTAPGAQLRRFWIHLMAQVGLRSSLKDEHKEFWVKDALWDVFRASYEMWRNGRATTLNKDAIAKLDLCEYHCHEDGLKCEKVA
ncbi:hypothetical protein BAUCODRAFT_387901 [Baudoinia panamericana UAMH 10762]|uniref:BTB domain-containing protein n=1 Tax=Baudoinia panamericana (strain UAMH 10762) TaxID=717646 RepID=M2NI54_BAUPA|nr:uncharacterized protein BAUCODRAFT_387901 [Baudoinia panamericana UAMH 10762]EMC99029.1 hypothetical protein BAUCODRAFT_387901 [Baudoinia panamericana UAMH 10762]